VARAENVNITEDGLESLLRLGFGDMRKYLNILQATAMAFPVVNTDALYATTGLPLPSDVRAAAEWLLNDDLSSTLTSTALLTTELNELRREQNHSLLDLVIALHNVVMRLSLQEQAKVI
jgi:replication factor C subunit 3/5